MFGLGYQELLLILVIVLVMFGGSKLPGLAKSLGSSLTEFKKGIAGGRKKTAHHPRQDRRVPPVRSPPPVPRATPYSMRGGRIVRVAEPRWRRRRRPHRRNRGRDAGWTPAPEAEVPSRVQEPEPLAEKIAAEEARGLPGDRRDDHLERLQHHEQDGRQDPPFAERLLQEVLVDVEAHEQSVRGGVDVHKPAAIAQRERDALARAFRHRLNAPICRRSTATA